MNKQEIEKAISYWSEFKAEIKNLRKQNPKVDWDEQEKAVDVAIEALEKQMPKKPKVMETTLVGEKFWWYCGHCGASIHTGSKANYCGYCGGKADWRNEDE